LGKVQDATIVEVQVEGRDFYEGYPQLRGHFGAHIGSMSFGLFFHDATQYPLYVIASTALNAARLLKVAIRMRLKEAERKAVCASVRCKLIKGQLANLNVVMPALKTLEQKHG
jgi:hypothetical protein